MIQQVVGMRSFLPNVLVIGKTLANFLQDIGFVTSTYIGCHTYMIQMSSSYAFMCALCLHEHLDAHLGLPSFDTSSGLVWPMVTISFQTIKGNCPKFNILIRLGSNQIRVLYYPRLKILSFEFLPLAHRPSGLAHVQSNPPSNIKRGWL